MRIFVGGSLENVPRDKDLCYKFVLALGHKIVEQGHTLLNGCRSSLDLEIARAAQEWLDHTGQSSERIISYCLRDEKPIHSIGRVRTSALSDWNMSHPDLKVPEQIDMADVTIFIAGNEGTFWAKNWASYARKLILGVPRFGGAGETIYDQELIYFQANYPTLTEDYETLNQLVINDIENYAKDIIDLAERLVTPRSVFTIMSFEQEFDDVYDSYKSVCKEFDFEAERTDDSESLERIIPRIEIGIRQSAIVLADVSDSKLSLNIFYELGFAKALGKDVIVTAKKGTTLPFDLSDIPTIFWNTQTELKQDLRKRLDSIKHKYGR